MTCIVGVEHDGYVTIGGDSCISDQWEKQTMVSAKVWKRGEFIYGGCGSLRALQIVKFLFSAPQLPDNDDDDAFEEYLVTEWSEVLRETFNAAGAQKIKHEIQETPDSWFMFGVRGRLWTMGPDYSVYQIDRGYNASGSGEQYALGALEATKKSRMPVQDRLEVALNAASAFAPGVAPPYHYVTTHEDAED
jgi:hypothetical protein